jgi:hypothetical protein
VSGPNQRAAATEPSPPAVAALATELARLRQRGIHRVDLLRDRLQPLVLPILDALAEVDATSEPRVQTLQRFMRSKLVQYGAANRGDADFIDELFFDHGSAVSGAGAPSILLQRSRRSRSLSASGFRRLQREHFLAFAAYLLTEPPRRRSWRRRSVAMAGLVVAITALLMSYRLR